MWFGLLIGNILDNVWFDLLTAPRGGSTAAPDKFCAFVSIDSGLWKIIESVEFSFLRSLAFVFCQFLAALGIFSKLCF